MKIERPLAGYQYGEMFFFDEDSRQSGGRDQHQVIIQEVNNRSKVKEGKNEGAQLVGPYVLGYLQTDFDYNVTAEFETMFEGVIDKVPGSGLITKAAVLTGRPVGASGIFKRKFYKGGGYVTFNVDFRIFSDKKERVTDQSSKEGEIQSPKNAADWLAALCLPGTPWTAKEVFEKAKDAKKSFGGDDTQAANFSGGIKNAVYEASRLLHAPTPRAVRVKIGNMFDSYDMIVESVNIKFSRQSVYSGNGKGSSHSPKTDGTSNLRGYQPLYVDISMSVSTATVPQGSNTGLLSSQPVVTLASALSDVGGFGNIPQPAKKTEKTGSVGTKDVEAQPGGGVFAPDPNAPIVEPAPFTYTIPT